MNKTFIQNLKNLMKENKLNQKDLAKILYVDQTTISAWLRGESEPSLSKICLILNHFNCKFEDLLD